MKYFIDTEFIERPGSIQLISIGIVAEDGREYYAISNEFDVEAVWNDHWLRSNVLIPIYDDLGYNSAVSVSLPEVKEVIQNCGILRSRILTDILKFIGDDKEIQFYGYFADYDWVVFCWLFGRMIDLPDKYPKYCLDLKQMMIERGLDNKWKQFACPDAENEHNALADAKWNMELYKEILLATD